MQIIIDSGSVAMALTAIGGAAVALYRWFFRPLKVWVRHVHDVVTYELQENGGGSMKDSMDRLESQLAEHMEDARAHHSETKESNHDET